MTQVNEVTVTDNRTNATTDHAQTLKRVWLRLGKKLKELKAADRVMRDSWGDKSASMDEVRTDFYDAQHEYHAAQQECWAMLKALPSNTVASGGANPQSVAQEFYCANLNRTLANRSTVADAKKRNRASFAPAA